LTLTGADGITVRSVLVGAAPPLVGDSNGDGQFNQQDIVLILQAGKYNRDEPATRAQGDWNGDTRFDQLDIVAALQAGTYMTRPQAAAADAVHANRDDDMALGPVIDDDLEVVWRFFLE
jgi:hypothetical protein